MRSGFGIFAAPSLSWERGGSGCDKLAGTTGHFADGVRIVFLSYGRNGDVRKDREMLLRAMPSSDRKIGLLASFTGGLGSTGSPSWSPDSKRAAFVSCQSIH